MLFFCLLDTQHIVCFHFLPGTVRKRENGHQIHGSSQTLCFHSCFIHLPEPLPLGITVFPLLLFLLHPSIPNAGLITTFPPASHIHSAQRQCYVFTKPVSFPSWAPSKVTCPSLSTVRRKHTIEFWSMEPGRYDVATSRAVP